MKQGNVFSNPVKQTLFDCLVYKCVYLLSCNCSYLNLLQRLNLKISSQLVCSKAFSRVLIDDGKREI